MRFTWIGTVMMFAMVNGFASAQEKVENGEFKVWSKYKKGTSITLRTTSVAGGFASEMTMTTTLVEVGVDKLVVEGSTSSKVMGMEFKTPPIKREVPKTLSIPKGVKVPDMPSPTAKPEGVYEDGTETLKIAGVELKTKWYKYRSDTDGLKTAATMWVCEDVPGGLVKMESTTSGAAESSTKMELVEFKRK